MTTVIMISSDNSIIINNSHNSTLEEHRNYEWEPGRIRRDESKTSPGISSQSSQDSENFESGTPDSSFLTPLNPNRTRRTERTREILRTKDNSNLRVRTDVRRRHANSWFEGGSRENIRVGNGVRRTGRESIHGEPGFRRIELRGEERLIKKPTDSDFEEFNISSSSAASTLSSRTSGVSSGATSSTSRDMGTLSGVNSSGSRDPAKESQYRRKFTTLNKPSRPTPPKVSRTQSFQCLPTQRLIPSENSAFKVPALPRFLQKESHPNKFLTSTPIRDSSMGNRSLVKQKQNIKVLRHNSFLANPDNQVPYPPLYTRNPTQSLRGLVPVRQDPARTRYLQTCLSLENGPSGSKYYFNPSGGLDIKPQNYHKTRSIVKCSQETESNYNTRSLGRNAGISGRESSRHGSEVTSNFCTLSRRPSRSSLSPTDKSSSDLSDMSELSRSLQSNESSKSNTNSMQSLSDPCPESRVDLSPMNDNYSKIYSQPGESSFTSFNNESVYNTVNNRLQPIGSVFPSGCHRHPERFPRAGNLDSICSDLASLKTGESETQSSRSSLSGECSECRTICHCRLSSSTRTLSNDSGLMKERSETSDIVSEDSDSVYRTKSCDRIGSRSGFKQKFISEKPNKRKPVMSHLSNLSLLSGGVKLAGLVGSGTKILRRHTTYIRNPGAGAEEVKVNSGHIHTWNRQDVGTGELKTSSLRRNLIRRANSTYRLSHLFRKDEDEDIAVTDSQSLDRLSIQTQEEENLLRPRGRVADWGKDFDNLLSDKYGLYKFTEFLKQEFSHENIYFWCACEKFRLIEDGDERMKEGKSILDRHLRLGACDPVNLDAATGLKLVSDELLEPPERDLFLSAQNQIYNLMKFDSYPRFLKSRVYTECVIREMNGSSLNEVEFSGIDNEPPSGTDTGVRLRHRKYKDREKNNRLSIFWDTWGRKDGDDVLSGEKRESACTLTRLILPNGSTSVVSTTSGESIRALVSRLIEKRGLKLSTFEVITTLGEKQLDLSEDCDILGCSEVRVEQRICFKLEIPGQRTLAVKTKIYKTIHEVLFPLLKQYGLDVSESSVWSEDGKHINIDDDVATIDNKKLVVRPSRDLSAPENKDSNKDPEMSLFEGLQIMRRGRLEDQRGTEISFEIPDFLKITNSSSHGARMNHPARFNKDNLPRNNISRDLFNDSSPTLGFV